MGDIKCPSCDYTTSDVDAMVEHRVQSHPPTGPLSPGPESRPSAQAHATEPPPPPHQAPATVPSPPAVPQPFAPTSTPPNAGEKPAFPKWVLPTGICMALAVVFLVIGAIASPSDDEEGAADIRTTRDAADPGGREDEGGDEGEAEPSTTEATTTEAPTTGSPTTTTTIPPAWIQAEVEAEAQRACQAGGTTGEADDIDFDTAWEQEGHSRASIQQHADQCAADARAAAAANAGPIDVDAVVRNPDAVEGQFFRVVALVLQFDAATGQCAFRAAYDNTAHEYNFEYEGDNAVIQGADLFTCPELDGIDNDDVVTATVMGAGSLTYDTQIGGSTTVPLFEVVAIENVDKR